LSYWSFENHPNDQKFDGLSIGAILKLSVHMIWSFTEKCQQSFIYFDAFYCVPEIDKTGHSGIHFEDDKLKLFWGTIL